MYNGEIFKKNQCFVHSLNLGMRFGRCFDKKLRFPQREINLWKFLCLVALSNH